MGLKGYFIWGFLILAAGGTIAALFRFYSTTPPKDKDHWPGDYKKNNWQSGSSL